MSTWRPVVTAVEGRYLAASNVTLLGTTADGDRVVYKPTRGVRPLWDFPAESLAMREVWTYRIATVVAPGAVPETVLGDGMYGSGAVQRWMETDDDFDPVPLIQRADASLWPLALLDVVTNNADRKVGHILRMSNGSGVVGIDHGLTLHPDGKLRTVLWSFAGRTVPGEQLAGAGKLVTALAEGWAAELTEDLGNEAASALAARTQALLATGTHPQPPEDRPAWPWPIY